MLTETQDVCTYIDDGIEEEEVEEKREYRTITIRIGKISQMEPCFTAADVVVETSHMNEILGATQPIPVIKDDNIEIDFQVDKVIWPKLPDTINNLISNPIYFTVYQYAANYDAENYASEEKATVAELKDTASCAEMEEILGVIIPESEHELQAQIKGKKSKVSKTSKSDKLSVKKEKKKKGSKSPSLKSKKSTPESNKKRSQKQTDPRRTIGHCNLDLFPFVDGKSRIKEKLVVCQPEIYNDDRLISHGNLPRLAVEAVIDLPIFEEAYKLENVLKFTVESLYNIPDEWESNLNYKIASLIPGEMDLQTVFFDNGKFTNDYNPKTLKKWENLVHVQNDSCFMNEEITRRAEGIKNKIKVNIEENFEPKISDEEENPYRIEWNVLKRRSMNAIGYNVLKNRLIRHRKWPIEIYISRDKQQPKTPEKGVTGTSDRGSKTSKGSKKTSFTPVHLMSFVDLSNLLYPGVNKCRVVGEIRTFQQFEMKTETGSGNSLFFPPKKPEPKDEVKKPDKKIIKDAKKIKSKPVKGKKNKNKKSEKSTTTTTELEQHLTSIIGPPSQVVTNFVGEPTFIIVEVELLRPIFFRRTLEDYTKELQTMLPVRDALPKYVISKQVCDTKLDECMKSIIGRLSSDYQEFMFGKNEKKAINPPPTLQTFYDCLLNNGNYQEYLNSLLKGIALYVDESYDLANVQQPGKTYQNFVSTIYVRLVAKMNTILNGPITCGLDVPKASPIRSSLSYVYRVREAEELNLPELAERYHKEEISKNSTEPNVWLHYAIFQLGLKNADKAYECVKECLALRLNHKYGLLLYAIMLFLRKEWYYSETTFLTLLNYYPRYLEGWVCLYVFYLARENHAGFDVCEERIDSLPNENVDENEGDDDLFRDDDIAWTTSISPERNKFFKTCMTLLKCNAFSFAELTMNYVQFPESGELKYYNAVLRYRTNDFENALLYLEKARKEHGPDFAVNSLIGHCRYKLGDLEEAKEAYQHVVLSYNRPDDMHLLYLNLALIHDKENDLQTTKQYLLHVCKWSATPYDWLLLGICYFKEESWTFAEKCFKEANFQDNLLPETWAYLTLLNVKVRNPWIANQCYRQMLKYNLQNEWLRDHVEKQMEKE